jgi:hypothetical protein
MVRRKTRRHNGVQTKRILIPLLVMAMVASAQAENYCSNDPQPTAKETKYADRVHMFLLNEGFENDTHFECGQEHTLFIGITPITQTLARSLAKAIGLGTAKVAGYSKIWFSENSAEDVLNLWEYDVRTRKVRHGVQRSKEIQWQ